MQNILKIYFDAFHMLSLHFALFYLRFRLIVHFKNLQGKTKIFALETLVQISLKHY